MEVPFKKLKTELPYDSAILLLGIHIEKTKTLIQKDVCTLIFITALFVTAWEHPKCPSIEEKRCEITGIVPSHKSIKQCCF